MLVYSSPLFSLDTWYVCGSILETVLDLFNSISPLKVFLSHSVTFFCAWLVVCNFANILAFSWAPDDLLLRGRGKDQSLNQLFFANFSWPRNYVLESSNYYSFPPKLSDCTLISQLWFHIKSNILAYKATLIYTCGDGWRIQASRKLKPTRETLVPQQPC